MAPVAIKAEVPALIAQDFASVVFANTFPIGSNALMNVTGALRAAQTIGGGQRVGNL